MTREEAIEVFEKYKANAIAIQKYEVNAVLDKIRTEIVELWKNEPCTIEHGCLDEILQIIDKYKAENESKERKDNE